MRVAGTNFHRRSIAAAHAEAEKLRNVYEAARTISPSRPYVSGYVRDQRFDSTQADRTEMSRKIRDYERNVWIVRAIKREFTKWTVGPGGLQVIPETDDDVWDEEMLADYLLWCRRPCYDSTLSMGQVHKQIAGEFSIEGGLFWHETFRKVRNGPSEPAIELFRGHQVGSPPYDSSKTIDGVEMGEDEFGNPAVVSGYWVRNESAPSGWTFRSTDVMHHIWDPSIPGSVREITPYHAVIDTLGDLKQMEEWEVQRAKANAEDAKIFKTVSGQIPVTQLMRERFRGATPEAGQEADLEHRLEVYRRILGPRSIALRVGEEVVTPENNNPSAAQQWLWRYKLGQVCATNGMPLMLIFPELIESAQGTLIRGVYDSAHEFFRGNTLLFAAHAIRMYLFYANWARQHRPTLFRHPKNWSKCRVILPRAVNVDIGYTAEAQIAKLDAGLTDWDTEAGALGTTAEDIARRKARQIIKFRRIADEESQRSNGYFVKPEEIAGSLADIREKLAAAVAANKPKPTP